MIKLPFVNAIICLALLEQLDSILNTLMVQILMLNNFDPVVTYLISFTICTILTSFFLINGVILIQKSSKQKQLIFICLILFIVAFIFNLFWDELLFSLFSGLSSFYNKQSKFYSQLDKTLLPFYFRAIHYILIIVIISIYALVNQRASSAETKENLLD